MSNSNIQLGFKDQAWFDDPDNEGFVLKPGQQVHLIDGSGLQTGRYKMGDDNGTILSALGWLGTGGSGTADYSTITGDPRDDSALAAYLDAKENLANKKSTIVSSATEYPNSNGVISYVQNQLNTVIRDQGNYDASSNTFPTTGGSGSGGAIEKGNQFTISVSGTLGGTAVTSPYSIIRALVDTPGQTAANWFVENRVTPVIITTNNRRIVLYQNTNSSVTGTLVQTILTPNTFIIPAGTMGLNSVLHIEAFVRKSGTAGTCEWAVYANTSYSLSGAKLLGTSGSHFLSSSQTMGFIRRIVNKNSLSLQNTSSISSFTGDTLSTNGFISPNVNFALAQYIMLTATAGNIADTCTLDNIQIYVSHP